MSAFVLGFQYLQLRINGTEIEVFLRATGGEHPHLIHFIVASDGLYDNQIQQLKLPRDERNSLIYLHGNVLLVSIRSGRIVVRDTGPLRPSYSILVTFTLIRPVLNGQIVVLFFCSIHHDLVTSSSYLWAFCNFAPFSSGPVWIPTMLHMLLLYLAVFFQIMRCSCLKRDALFIPYQSSASKKHSSILASLGLGPTTGEESERFILNKHKKHLIPDEICPPDARIRRKGSRQFLLATALKSELRC